ncbi:hypothetical protein [Streptomyces sp. NBC_01283]|uniref:hypothetical protein n=1 Tax=Streptomyces sp. NBC_01283 TaxID=2903812 RepID=UPI00352FAC9F
MPTLINDPFDDCHQSVPGPVDASVLRADLGAFEHDGDLGRGLFGVGQSGWCIAGRTAGEGVG